MIRRRRKPRKGIEVKINGEWHRLFVSETLYKEYLKDKKKKGGERK